MPMKTRPLNRFSVFTPFWPACWPANAPGTSRPRRPSAERILLWRHALPKPCPGPLRRRRRFAPHGARCGKPQTGPRASRSSTSAWAAWPQGFPPPAQCLARAQCKRTPKGKARHVLCKHRKAWRALFSVCAVPKMAPASLTLAAPSGRPQSGWGAPRAVQVSRCGTCLWRGGSGPQICSPASG